jgi:hypothetical protein
MIKIVQISNPPAGKKLYNRGTDKVKGTKYEQASEEDGNFFWELDKTAA